MIDVANQKFYGELNGRWLTNSRGSNLGHTFHLEFHGTYTGDETTGTFEGTGNLTSFNIKMAKTEPHPVCTISGKLENGMVSGTCSNSNGTDYFNLPAR